MSQKAGNCISESFEILNFSGGMHLDPFEWHVAKQHAMLAMQT